VHYDEHFLAETARGVGQYFEDMALFPTQTHRGCGRPLASDTGHGSSMGASRSGIPWAET
jgi:hypothetical protein